MMRAVALNFFRDWVRDDWADVRDRDSLALATEPIAEQTVRLTKQIGVLRAQVQELSAAVAVLLKVVAERGELDLPALEARIEREHAAHCNVRQTPPVVCIRCKRTVPANTTMITADGVICETACT
ncbi:MAG TPA: hypothetical protein VN253_12555 [Kofleriaceae bacterium]|nr:hypothetical protein [Kofleriaceae bacterium]